MQVYKPKEIEKEVRDFWSANQIPHKVLSKKGKIFNFLDGPPYIQQVPHVGHARNRFIKDAVLRWLAMRGWQPYTKPGFDCHGLPLEVWAEKKLGLKSKKDIYKFGLKKFLSCCNQRAKQMANKWSEIFENFGEWLYLRKPYLTLSRNYISEVWKFFKKSWDKGLLKKGKRTVAWCPRCETALAGYEVKEEYREVEDPSIWVKVRLESGDYALIWTTTPWTLPANRAIAVHPEKKYVKVKVNSERWILAKQKAEEQLSKLGKDYKPIEIFKGKELKGIRYEPILTRGKSGVLVTSELVELEKTGLVHIAPGHGEEDFFIGKKYGLEIYSPLNESCRFTKEEKWLEGKSCSKSNQLVIEKLRKLGKLLFHETIRHKYPHCWRCKSPIYYRASDEWFIKVSLIRDELLKEASKIKWKPGWASNTFKEWIKKAEDWCVSRKRFWGTPLPIWSCGKHQKVVGFAELKKIFGEKLEDLHKVELDKLRFKCQECGKQMERIPEVADVWIDSGCASWASSKEWPVDFITESWDQLPRGWFYSLLVCGFITKDSLPYRSVLMSAFVQDAKGEKMSKSKGNVIHPNDSLNRWGADLTRFYELSFKPWQQIAFDLDEIKEFRSSFNILFNCCRFLKTYWPQEKLEKPKAKRKEDRWLESRLNSLIKEVTRAFKNYRFDLAVSQLEKFWVKDLSRFWLRFSRDKVAEQKKAAGLLRQTLLEISKLLAPLAPFAAESIWQNLQASEKESVHLAKWPKSREKLINEKLEHEVAIAKKIISAANLARQEESMPLRWPLKAIYVAGGKEIRTIARKMSRIIKKLTNSRQLECKELPRSYQLKLRYERIGPKYGPQVKEIESELNKAEPEKLIKKLDKGVELAGVKLSKEDFLVRKTLPVGYKGADFEGGSLVLDLETDRELEEKRLMRELFHSVQLLRKKKGMKVNQPAKLTISAKAGPEKIIRRRLDELKKSVAAKQVEFEKPPTTEGKCQYKDWEVKFAIST